MSLSSIPVEFVIFVATLVGIALVHRLSLVFSIAGLFSVTLYKVFLTGFGHGPGVAGLLGHLASEWVALANLLLLLLGFAILANHFERSKVPDVMPNLLPDDWTGGLALLGIVFALSAFLDNIAAALIGGVIAKHVYKNGVSVGFLAAIVACANAGGAGSIVGDTTTTMLWIAGISPFALMKAFIGAVPAFIVVGIFAARRQHRYAPITKDAEPGIIVDGARVGIVFFALAMLIAANVLGKVAFKELDHRAPLMGLALWASILLTAIVRKPEWAAARAGLKGAVFLVALVAMASLMPVHELPPASRVTVLGLGFLSAAFDNIPLTALAIDQGGYDWPLLAYAVGFGGSMAWFGSSAGVALTELYPEGRSLGRWVREGWYIPLAYGVGFLVMVLVSR